MKVGVVGLGHMGAAMATALLKAGHELVVFNRTPEKAAPLVALGARQADTIADACRTEVVITMLADDAAVEAVVLREDGVVAHLPAEAVHVSSSTVSLALAERLTEAHARAGRRFVSAPVFGRPDAAAQAKLYVMAASEPAAVEQARPVLDAVGQKTTVLGTAPPAANLAKLGGNFLIASVIESLGEALALVEKGGVDRRAYLDLLTSSLFDAPVYRTYGGLIAARAFEPAGFAARLGAKDLRLALQAAEDLRVPLPFAGILRDRFLRLLAEGGEDLDWSAVGALAARDAGLPD